MCALNMMVHGMFQSTHPRRVWPGYIAPHTFEETFQSTHPRRVWLYQRSKFLRWHRVSIHTPTKGVTALRFALPSGIKVSIHTPTKGVTMERQKISQLKSVSIHTPTKGVTSADKVTYTNNDVSIHTPTKGVTGLIVGYQSSASVSIHTPTKGVTPGLFLLPYGRPCFNPHTHEGCDLQGSLLRLQRLLFQSTHPRRVWRKISTLPRL